MPIVLQWSFANPKLGTVCVPRPLTHFEVPIIAGRNIAGRESGNFRCPVFLLHGTGFRQVGRRLFLSASRNLGITLQSEVRNLRQTFHKFSSAATSGVFTFYSRVDKVLHHAPGFGKFCLDIQQRLRRFTYLQNWPLVFFITVQLADGADLEPYSVGSGNDYPIPLDESPVHDRVSMSWAVPFICSAFCLIFTWALQKWWRMLPVFPLVDRIDDPMSSAMFDRINEENNSCEGR